MKHFCLILIVALLVSSMPIFVGAQSNIVQSTTVYRIGGNVRGVGMLAQYLSAGNRTIKVKRTTNPTLIDATAINPPIALVRVIDPTGKLVSYYDFTNQEISVQEIVLNLSMVTTGIWRVSFSGGRQGDKIEFSLPYTDVWGIRGEMALGLSETMPQDMFIYLPRTTKQFMMFGYGSANTITNISVYNSNNGLLGSPTYFNERKRYEFITQNVETDSVWKISKGSSNDYLLFSGVPGLLCPSKNAAEILKGGIIESEGFLVQGPLQAQVRQKMVELSAENTVVNLTFPDSVPFSLENPQKELQLFGSYGGLSSLQNGLNSQMLDVNSPYYGAFPDTADDNLSTRTSWETFLYGGRNNLSDAEALANLTSIKTQLNPAYGNRALAVRAMLAAFYHFVSMQGDDLIREGDLTINSYPISHIFFSYPSMASGLNSLKGTLSADEFELWKNCLLAVGDKLADFPSYQSNQWAHVINGHLYTYFATGEQRF